MRKKSSNEIYRNKNIFIRRDKHQFILYRNSSIAGYYQNLETLFEALFEKEMREITDMKIETILKKMYEVRDEIRKIGINIDSKLYEGS